MNVVSIAGTREPAIKLSPAESPLYFHAAERPLYWRDRFGGYHESPDHKQIVRTSDNGPLPLAVVSKSYKVLQNADLFNALDAEIIDKIPHDKLQNVVIKDSLSYDGALSVREMIFEDMRTHIEGRGGHNTSVAFRAIIINGFGQSAVKIIVGAIDFFCSNGMIIGVTDRVVRRHTSGLSVDPLVRYITGNISIYEKNAQQWCKWAKHGVAMDDVRGFFGALVEDEYVSARLAEKLLDRYVMYDRRERGDTLWALLSTLTYYASHSDARSGFAVRETGKDHATATLLKRGEDVKRIVSSNYFQRLAA